MKNIKWENIVFIMIFGEYAYNAIINDINNLTVTLIANFLIALGYRCAVKYVRKKGIKNTIIKMMES